MLGLIPAKGVSSRIPRKNMALLGGHPLIDWTIGPAIASGVFSELWVSSEDSEILSHAELRGAKGLRRPAALAEPSATIADVIEATRRMLEYRGPIYVLAPTSPFRRPTTICAVAQASEARAHRDLLSVIPAPLHPWEALRFDGPDGTVIPAAGESYWSVPRSGRPEAFAHDGGHWIVRDRHPSTRWLSFMTPEDESIDVNTPRDLAFAEFLLQTGRVPWLTSATAR